MDKLEILELPTEEMNNSVQKNAFIARCRKEYLAIVDRGKITSKQLENLLEKEEMFSYGGVIAFCAGNAQDAVQLPLEDALECATLQIVALVFRRDLLADSGNYNFKLQSMTDFEMLCRLTESYGNCIFVFPGIEEDALAVTEEDAFTCAYIMRRYLAVLQSCDKLKRLLEWMCLVMKQSGVRSVFTEELNKFLNVSGYYESIAVVTAPLFIFRGDDTCYGVLQDFADCLANSLHAIGQAYILGEPGKIDYDYLLTHVCKAFVGFQSKAFILDFFKNLSGPKIQFWFDNPVFYEEHFSELPEDCFILCHDTNYVEFIKAEYHKKNAKLLPPGGHALPWSGSDNRPYDIVFIGGYVSETDIPMWEMDKEYYEYMLQHPEMSFTDGLRAMLSERGMNDSELSVGECFSGIKHICKNVINHYRKKVMETILEAGYEVHVYGDSWDAYQSSSAHRLIRHPAISVEESLQEWQKAKIGLNMMSWHKAGMTERIANIMLSGAVCLSEETDYLKENFREGEEVVTFKLSQLEELPEQIRQLLANDNWRRIARKGYEIASREHTWERRTLQLLEVVEDII